MSVTVVEALSSKGCEVGIEVRVSIDFFMKYAILLVMAEKAGGDSVHPIES